MNDKTYNGWSNYATWRVNIEMFDGVTLEDLNTVETEPYELKNYLEEYAEEIIFLGNRYDERRPSNLMEDYARAFLSDVNWYEIAEHMIKDHIEENKE
tara:strand:- start:1392 stop:1685 length:294 start_codon:yes stop_codon:yes gene_type:complete